MDFPATRSFVDDADDAPHDAPHDPEAPREPAAPEQHTLADGTLLVLDWLDNRTLSVERFGEAGPARMLVGVAAAAVTSSVLGRAPRVVVYTGPDSRSLDAVRARYDVAVARPSGGRSPASRAAVASMLYI